MRILKASGVKNKIHNSKPTKLTATTNDPIAKGTFIANSKSDHYTNEPKLINSRSGEATPNYPKEQ